jgi:hypothetical protein
MEDAISLLKEFRCWIDEKIDVMATTWKNEIDELIDKKNKKYPKVLRSISDFEAQEFIPESPLEKLLMAIVWKQGDYSKIKKFVNTLNNEEEPSDQGTGLVFHQFARHMKGFKEPMIDQHVLRAYLALKHFENKNQLEKIRRRGAVTKKDAPLVAQYIDWYTEKASKLDSKYSLDDYLFVLGKKIKLKS